MVWRAFVRASNERRADVDITDHRPPHALALPTKRCAQPSRSCPEALAKSLRLRHFVAGLTPGCGPDRGGPVWRRIPAANRPTRARRAVTARGGPVHGRMSAPDRPTLPEADPDNANRRPGVRGRRTNAKHNRPRSLPSMRTDHAGTTTRSERNAQADARPERSRQTRSAPRPAPHDDSLERSATRAARTIPCCWCCRSATKVRRLVTTLRNPPIPSAPPCRLRRSSKCKTPATAQTARGHDPRSVELP